jgi:hypothetical protein
VFGKESSDRVKLSKAINDPQKKGQSYSNTEALYNLDALGLDQLQCIEISHSDLFHPITGELEALSVDCPRRLANASTVIKMLQSGKKPRQIVAKYMPKLDGHKTNMLEATKLLSQQNDKLSENSFENMQAQFKLSEHLDACVVDVDAWNAEHLFEWSQTDDGSRPPPDYFEVFEPFYGPETAFREGIQIYISVFYFIEVRIHDTGEGIYFPHTKWSYGYDIEFDTIFFDDRSWQKNSKETQLLIVDAETQQPFTYFAENEYQAKGADRLFDAIVASQPTRTKGSFGAPELFQYGLKRLRLLNEKGD